MNNNEFPTVEELSDGFSEFKLESKTDLLGEKIDIYFEDGTSVIYEFLTEDTLNLEYTSDNISKRYVSIYSIVSPREGIYLVDFIEHRDKAFSVTSVIDMNKNIVTSMRASLPSKEEAYISQLERAIKKDSMTSVKASFIHGSIGKKFDESTSIHPFTKDLLGKKILFKYSSNDSYEHYYLNENFYTWHCISGVEKGLCDTDKCYYIKLDENLYWFTWLEKVVPTIGTVIEDLCPDVMRSYGKIAGYEFYDHGEITNFQVGSYAREL